MALGTVRVRKARPEEADAIARLNNEYAGAGLMLRRSPEVVALAIDDYVVAANERGRIFACGALKEYSPSLAEVSAIAVSREAQGLGLGRAVVRAVEALALKRGICEVFALTLQPQFFEAVGYAKVERARYPEKIRRDCLGCARLFACDEICYMRDLAAVHETAILTAA
jgi:N-acetylglutamate synthase-like GNAT family acetyltransferase